MDLSPGSRDATPAPYFVFSSVPTALISSVVSTLLALLVFGYIKGMFTSARPCRSAWQTVVVGGLAATAAFVIAKAMGQGTLQRIKSFKSRKTQAMATKAGVWIDHKQAVVVLITEAGQEIKKVHPVPEPSARPAGGSRSKNKYTPNDFVAEDRQERKVGNDRKDYFDNVIASVRGADSLLILGPGEAKGEFEKHVLAKKIRGLAVERETSDKMTDRQIAAKVSEHFTKVPARKSVAPKKKAKAVSGKRTTKRGK